MRQASPFFFLLFSLGALLLTFFPPTLIKPEKNSGTSVVDMSKRRVTIPVPARRVVIYPPVAWDYMTVDEGPEHILAVAHFTREELGRSLLGRIYPACTRIPIALTRGLNTAIPGDPEEMLIARPDAILSWAHFSDALKAAGLPVVEVKLPIDTGPGMLAFYGVIASVCARGEREGGLIAHYLQKRGDVGRRVADLGTVKRPTALCLWDVSGHIMVANGDTYFSRPLKVAGARNLGDGYKAGIDSEQLLLLNPDVIILGIWGMDQGPAHLYERPQWQSLSAVKNRRLYRQPLGAVRMTGPVDEPLLELWMAELLYPDKMQKTFRKEFRAAYQEVYHYDLSDGEIDRNIFLNENRSSSGYDRFARDAGK